MNLLVKLGVDNSDFNQGLDASEKKAHSVSSGIMSAFTKMAEWGCWAPSSGLAGLGDVTLSTLVAPNYKHPTGGAVNAAAESNRVSAMGSGHPNGVNIALADASTRFISNSINFAVFRAMGTRAGGEVVTAEE